MPYLPNKNLTNKAPGKSALVIAFLVCAMLLPSCVTLPYGVYTDERDVSTQVSDRSIATDIKTRLMGQKLSEGWSVSVFCFRGKVFLVGEIPMEYHAWAEDLAKKTQGVNAVVTHWFTTPGLSSDTATALSLKANLIGASNVNSTQLSSVVHDGEAVLFGIVSDQGAVNRAVRAAQDTSGVTKVTSYIMY